MDVCRIPESDAPWGLKDLLTLLVAARAKQQIVREGRWTPPPPHQDGAGKAQTIRREQKHGVEHLGMIVIIIIIRVFVTRSPSIKVFDCRCDESGMDCMCKVTQARVMIRKHAERQAIIVPAVCPGVYLFYDKVVCVQSTRVCKWPRPT